MTAYPASDLELALKKHKYRLDGVDLVNVTAISGLMDDGKASAMAGSAAKITREGGNHRTEWDAKRDRGSRVHDHCEKFLRGQPIDCLPEDMGFVDGMEKFITDRDPQVLELEEIVLSHDGFGGRFDMVINLDGEVTLCDLKTGRENAVDHTLQLSAYRYATGIGVYADSGEQVGLRELPPITATACLYVKEDGTYDLTYYPSDKQAFGVFLSLLAAYQWTRTPAIKEIKNAWRKK